MAHVRVWTPPDLDTQHLAEPPEGDQTARTWTGATVCGRSGELRWIHWETVDEGRTCGECMALLGTYKPPLEGDYPGPP
jgi:hypothetical protein